MIPNKARVLPVRILKIWFDIMLILGGVAVIVFLGWLALSPFLMAKGDVPIDAVVQVALGERSWPSRFPLEFEPVDPLAKPHIQEARLAETSGELHFLTTSWFVHFSSVGGIMLGSVLILYLLWIVRTVLVNVLDDRPFEAANGRLLRRCGYIILVLGSVWPIMDYALSSYVLSKIVVTNLDLSPAITLEKDVFVVGLLFLVFGVILTRGHELQEHEQALEEDQALTI